MKKTYTAQSGHTLHLTRLGAVAAVDAIGDNADNYQNVYAVRNWDADGVTFFYVCTGFSMPGRRNEVKHNETHVFYRNGKMWSSFGTNIQTAIDGAQRDGWMYTK